MATATFPTAKASENLAVRVLSSSTLRTLSVEDCHVYKKRWLMLLIFSLCAVADAMHWLQYSIITETIMQYYGVSLTVVDFTAMSYGLTFIVFVFPSIYLIQRFGLKNMLICGDVMIIIASGLKLASLDPKYFYIGFTGQFLAGIAQVFIINVPSYLAGLWFPKNELSTACALGVLGTQIGVTLSFYIPPHLIGQKHQPINAIRKRLLYVYVYLAVLPVVLLPLLIFVFKSHPLKAPSYARLVKTKDAETGWSAMRSLLSNVNFMLVLVSYSLNVSVFYCLSTLLNQIIPDAELAGTIGATIIVFGIGGCFFFGWFLDKTHLFKLISLIAYSMAMVGLAIFWINVLWELHQSLYLIAASIIGAFLASYVIIAIEFASELTYPMSETISTSVLLASGEALSIIFIYITQSLIDSYGKLSVIFTTSAFMLAGLVPTCFIRRVRLKRLEASEHENDPRGADIIQTTRSIEN